MTKQTPAIPDEAILKPNPSRDCDYVVCHAIDMPKKADTDTSIRTVLVYVPDRHITQADHLAGMLQASQQDAPVEQLATQVLQNFCNLAVPRFARLWVTVKNQNGTTIVSAEERQPLWENPAVMQQIHAVERQALA